MFNCKRFCHSATLLSLIYILLALIRMQTGTGPFSIRSSINSYKNGYRFNSAPASTSRYSFQTPIGPPGFDGPLFGLVPAGWARLERMQRVLCEKEAYLSSFWVDNCVKGRFKNKCIFVETLLYFALTTGFILDWLMSSNMEGSIVNT